MTNTPAGQNGSERRIVASIAAHTSWAKTADRSARTAPARAALDAKFLAEADGDPLRAESLRKAHFRRLALKSAQTRRKSREVRDLEQRIEDLERDAASIEKQLIRARKKLEQITKED